MTSVVVRAPVVRRPVVADQWNWDCIQRQSGLLERLATAGLVQHSVGPAATRASQPVARCSLLVVTVLSAAMPDIDWIVLSEKQGEHQVQNCWRNQVESAAVTLMVS